MTVAWVIEENPALVLDGSATITIKCKEFQFGQEELSWLTSCEFFKFHAFRFSSRTTITLSRLISVLPKTVRKTTRTCCLQVKMSQCVIIVSHSTFVVPCLESIKVQKG